MGVEDWYVFKSQECSRLSRAATDPRQRYALAEEADRWREIADDIVRQERSEAPQMQQQPMQQQQQKTKDEK
jgi:hypothetical protein